MVIREIKIKNFGQYSDYTLTFPGGGFQRIAEANEFGKTTLAEFIRRILFGFPDGRSNLNAYPGSDPKNYGGSLVVKSGDAVFEIERLNGRLRIIQNQSEITDPSAFLKQYLTVSESFYRNVYAITIDELNQIKLLDEAEIKSRLYGAGLSLGSLSIDRLQSDFSKRAAALYSPRGQKHQIAQINREIEDCESQLRSVSDQIPKYEAAVTALTDYQKQKTALQQQTLDLERQLKELDRLRQCSNAYQKLQVLQAELKTFGTVEIIPVDQWELELAKLRLAVRQNQEQQQVIARQLAELPPDTVISPDVALRELALQELGNRFFIYERDREDLAKLQTETAPQSRIKTWIALLAVAALLILSGLVSHFLLIVPGIILLLPCWLIYTYNQQQRDKRQIYLERIAAWQTRIAEFEEKFAGHFPGRPPDRQLIQQALMQAIAAKNQAERTRISRESLAMQHAHLSDQQKHLERAVSDFWHGRQCDGEEAYRQKIAGFTRYRDTRKNCEDMQKHLTEIFGAELLARCENVDAAELDRQFDQLTQEHRQLAAEAAKLTENFGSAGQIVDNFRRLPDPAALRNTLEALNNRRRDIYRDYLIVTRAAELLGLAIAKFEKERQPQVIRHAGALFEKFTAKRYVNLRKTLEGALLVFDTVTNADKNPLQLSRGTLDLLMLSLRLALIEYCEEAGPSLPVILDDVAVNIDETRTAALLRTLQEFAARRQVLFFCKK